GWGQRDATPGSVRDGEWLIGLGVAAAVRINLLMDSEARVTLGSDGRATIETDMTDIGTGSYTILAQIAGEALGLPIEA
ncbi:molybdopterin cofactor-binding domain-containing protein, partial [Escherichia coli]|uniref:molybdopterin cofactor-binding domain-containing protein n=5 Tax=Bacteria TaxID=2 RepID=UPI003F29ECD3